MARSLEEQLGLNLSLGIELRGTLEPEDAARFAGFVAMATLKPSLDYISPRRLELSNVTGQIYGFNYKTSTPRRLAPGVMHAKLYFRDYIKHVAEINLKADRHKDGIRIDNFDISHYAIPTFEDKPFYKKYEELQSLMDSNDGLFMLSVDQEGIYQYRFGLNHPDYE